MKFNAYSLLALPLSLACFLSGCTKNYISDNSYKSEKSAELYIQPIRAKDIIVTQDDLFPIFMKMYKVSTEDSIASALAATFNKNFPSYFFKFKSKFKSIDTTSFDPDSNSITVQHEFDIGKKQKRMLKIEIPANENLKNHLIDKRYIVALRELRFYRETFKTGKNSTQRSLFGSCKYLIYDYRDSKIVAMGSTSSTASANIFIDVGDIEEIARSIGAEVIFRSPFDNQQFYDLWHNGAKSNTMQY